MCLFVSCFPAQQGHSDYIITEGGGLKCKNIIHVIGGNDVKRSVTCVLQECEKRHYSSVCLPAIGTGLWPLAVEAESQGDHSPSDLVLMVNVLTAESASVSFLNSGQPLREGAKPEGSLSKREK